MRYLMLAVLLVCLPGCQGCSDYRNVPSGYAAKVLTPTGFQKKVYTSGQVDIGQLGANKIGNNLILVENTSITVKESFLGPAANPDKEDHRIVLQDDSVPMSVDVRISFMTPDFSKDEDVEKLFTLITPDEWKDDKRLQVIRLERIYAQTARLAVRSTIRDAIDKNTRSWKAAMASREKLNAEIAAATIKEVKDSGIPLKVKAVHLSMLMPDENVWKASAQISAAEAQVNSLKKLAKEIEALPNGIEIYRLLMMREAVEIGSRSGTNTVIWPIGSPMPSLPAARKIEPPAKEEK